MVKLCFPRSSVGKESPCNAGDLGSIPVRKIPWRRKWQPTPVLLLGKMPWTRGAWRATAWGCKMVRHDLVAKTATVFVLSYCDCWVSLNAFEVLFFTNHEDVPLWTPVAHQSRYHLFCASVLMPPFVFIMTFYLNESCGKYFMFTPIFQRRQWGEVLNCRVRAKGCIFKAVMPDYTMQRSVHYEPGTVVGAEDPYPQGA